MSRKRAAKQQTGGAAPAGKTLTAAAKGPAAPSGRRPKKAAHGRSAKRRGGTSTWLLLGIGLLFVLASVRVLSGISGPVGTPAVGAAAPALKMKTLDGQHIALADLRGKVVLVNFWATWCPPCRAEMPGFESVWRERQKDGFVVLGLSADDGPGQVLDFVGDRGISYPVGMASASARRAFGGVTSLPSSFLIDKKGVVRRTVTGAFDERLLRQDVNRLLRE